MKQRTLEKLQEFVRRYKAHREDYVTFAKEYVAIIDEEPEADDWLIKQGVPCDELLRLEQIGREYLHPALMFESPSVVQRLLDVPFAEQKAIVENPVPVVKERDGKLVTEYKRLPEMNGAEKRQAVGYTVDEQKQFLTESKKLEKLKKQSFIANEEGFQPLEFRFYTWDHLHEIEQRARKHLTALELATTLQEDMKKRQVK